MIHKTGHARGPSRGRRKQGRGCLFCLLRASRVGEPCTNARPGSPEGQRRPLNLPRNGGAAGRARPGNRPRRGSAPRSCSSSPTGERASVLFECYQLACRPRPPSPLDTHRETTVAEGAGRCGPRPQWGLSPSPPAGPERSGVPGSGGCCVPVSQPRLRLWLRS